MQDLADALGVSVDDLIAGGVTDPNDVSALAGQIVPAGIVATIQSDPLFEIALIEDLANMNMNFNIDVGDIALGEFTIRVIPTFAEIMMSAGNDLQWSVAGALDAANVPYLNADPAYLALIDDILALGTLEERQMALQSLSQDFLGSFSGLSYGLGSGALFALGTGGMDAGMEISSRGAGRWAMGGGTTGFVSITGGSSTQGSVGGTAPYSTNTLGVHAGIEYAVSPNWSMGLMVSGVNGDASIAGSRGSVDAEGYGLTGFARYSGAVAGGELNMRVALGMQNLSYDVTRNLTFPVAATATGSADGETLYAGIAADWMTGSGPMRYGPMGSLEYYSTSVDGYTETGAGLLNLTVPAMDNDMVVGRIGVQGLYSTATANGGRFELGGHLAYASRSGGEGVALASFAGSNLPGMASPTGSPDADWVDLGADLAVSAGDNSRFGVQYRGALFNDDYEDHRFGLFFEMSF